MFLIQELLVKQSQWNHLGDLVIAALGLCAQRLQVKWIAALVYVPGSLQARSSEIVRS